MMQAQPVMSGELISEPRMKYLVERRQRVLCLMCFRRFTLVQVGPLRAWPGGICLSRSIGDLDAGEYIVPVPHVKQIRVSGLLCNLTFIYEHHP